MMASKRRLATGWLVAGLLAALPAAAQEGGDWTVRLGAAGMASTGEGDDTGYGIGLGAEYRVSPRFGVELGAATAELESDPDVLVITFGDDELSIVPIELETSVRLTPLLARLNVHLTPGRRGDLYVAPVVGWVQVSDDVLRVRSLGTEHEVALNVDDELAWGAAVGLDVPLGEGGSQLSVNLTWLRLSIDSEIFGQDATAELDPLTVTAGYGFRF
jgi:outer membrane protein W